MRERRKLIHAYYAVLSLGVVEIKLDFISIFQQAGVNLEGLPIEGSAAGTAVLHVIGCDQVASGKGEAYFSIMRVVNPV